MFTRHSNLLCALGRLVGWVQQKYFLVDWLVLCWLTGLNAPWLAFLPRFVRLFLLSLKSGSHGHPWGPLSLTTSRLISLHSVKKVSVSSELGANTCVS